MKPTAEEMNAEKFYNGYKEEHVVIESKSNICTIHKWDMIRFAAAYADAVKSSLPPSEGAEEILRDNLNEHLWTFINTYPVAHKADVMLKDWIITAMQEHTALHAQKIADKMVEERMKVMEERCRKLDFMVKNGLGYEDMQNDISMPHEI